MKLVSHLVAGLLGLAFIAFGLIFLLKLGPTPPPPPEGSPMALFMGGFAPTGYLTLVKSLEVLGGLLVLFPLTRRAGLLVLGPILINILIFHSLVAGDGIFNPILLGLTLATLFVTWTERGPFLRFLRGN